jgi:hypothetical protein
MVKQDLESDMSVKVFVPVKVCARKSNIRTCAFSTSTKEGPQEGKCGLENSCSFKVIFNKERKNNGKHYT